MVLLPRNFAGLLLPLGRTLSNVCLVRIDRNTLTTSHMIGAEMRTSAHYVVWGWTIASVPEQLQAGNRPISRLKSDRQHFHRDRQAIAFGSGQVPMFATSMNVDAKAIPIAFALKRSLKDALESLEAS